MFQGTLICISFRRTRETQKKQLVCVCVCARVCLCVFEKKLNAYILIFEEFVHLFCVFYVAHSTASRAILWRKEMSGIVLVLRIHGGMVVVPAAGSGVTLVLNLMTGHPVHSLPLAGESVRGLCVFDGL